MKMVPRLGVTELGLERNSQNGSRGRPAAAALDRFAIMERVRHVDPTICFPSGWHEYHGVPHAR